MKTKHLILTLVVLLTSITASASVGINGIVYNFYGTTAEVTRAPDGYGYSGVIVIPNSVECAGINYSVTSIGEFAFYNCDGLTSITLPDGITSIGSAAFYNCYGLASINIPDGVTSIEGNAFYNCSSLTSINIPDGVTSIGEYAFSGCSSLTSITIPERVASIGECAFRGCRGLERIIVESGNMKYDSRNNCNAIIETSSNTLIVGCKNTTIPNSVTSIGEEAFYKCRGLTSINIPNSVTSIGNLAFSSCTGLTSINIPNSVTSIGNFAFSSCTGLTSINIPESVTSIGGSAFKGCSDLTSITIPESVTSIGPSAFAETAWLNNQPDGMLYINDIACAYIGTPSNNEEIIIQEGTKSLLSGAFNNITTPFSITLPNSFTSIGVDAFKGCSGLTSVTIPNSVTSIGSYAFYSCSRLTSVTIPNSVTSIGKGAFSGCSRLTSVTIGNSVTSIGEEAFRGCSSLTSVTIPDGVTSISEYAFQDCSSLTSVSIGNSVTSIGSYAFLNCSRLTSVIIGNSVTSIGQSAFSGCSGLIKAEFASIESLCSIKFENSLANPLYNAHHLYIDGEEVKDLIIPNSVTSIGSYAFEGCSGLTSITIPNSVTSIGWMAFYRCSSMTSVTIGNSVTSIGSYAFQGCSSLKSVTIGNSVTSIGSYAFYGCSGLTSITIPESVTTIGNYAFDNCSSLTKAEFASVESLCGIAFEEYEYYANPLSIAHNLFINGEEVKDLIIPNSVTSIGSYAFEGCSGLTSITIPESVTTIGKGAFRGCSGLIKAEFASIESLCSIKFENSLANPLYNAHHLYIDGEEVKDLIIPNSVTSIGSYAFYSCSSLTSVTIPNSVTSIGSYTFYGCSSLTSVTIPNSVTSIGSYTFYGCSGLTSVTIGNSVTSIASYAFDGCSGLTSITIPESVTTIGNYAFSNCSGLTSIAIPNSVTSIGSSAFYRCSRLTSVTIPNSVTSIGSSAFYLCSGLSSVKVDIETPLIIGSNNFSNPANATLYVPAGSKAAYQAADYWNEFKRIIEFIEGDVNGDENVNVADVVDIARYVVGTPAETFVQILADINNNGEVNLGDAVCLVNMIAGDQNLVKAMHAPRRVEVSEEALTLTLTDEGLSLSLENQRGYTAFQFDLYVPEAMDVTSMLLNAQRKQRHQLLYNKVEDGHWRVAAISTSNHAFNGHAGELLSIAVNSIANDDISIRNIRFFDTQSNEYEFDDICLSGTATNIEDLTPSSKGEASVYDLQGRKVANSQLPKGIYIVNGKKVVRR